MGVRIYLAIGVSLLLGGVPAAEAESQKLLDDGVLASAAANAFLDLGRLLAEGAAVNAADRGGRTALMLASYLGSTGTVTILLDHGADVHAKDNSGWTAIQYAAEGGHPEILRALKGAGAEAVSDLRYAAAVGDAAAVETALSRAGRSGRRQAVRALFSAIRHGHGDVVKVFLDHGGDAGSKMDVSSLSSIDLALLRAGYFGHSDDLDTAGRASGNDDDAWGLPKDETALMYAAFRGHAGIVRLLLERGARVEAKNSLGVTALMEAVYRGHPEPAQALLVHGADVNGKNRAGETPLMLAVYRGQVAAVKMLLGRGAQINARDKNGATALLWACSYYQKDPKGMISALLAAGADPKAKAVTGFSAEECVRQYR